MASVPPPPPGYGGPPPPPPGYRGPPPPPGYGAGPPGYSAPYGGFGRTTNGKAIAALICGIVAFVSCMFPLAIPAVILAPMAKREIKAQPERYEGEGLAQAGQILGWIMIGLIVAGALLLLVLGVTGNLDDDSTYYSSLAALSG